MPAPQEHEDGTKQPAGIGPVERGVSQHLNAGTTGVQMSIESLDHIVSGAIFDFAGFLTTRDQRITLSSTDDAAPAADAVKEFLSLRGVDPNCEPFFQWPYRCSVVRPCASPHGEALNIIRSAMRDDPHYAWTWHCNVAVSMMDESSTHDSANAAAARFMRLAFDVDTSKAPETAGMSDKPVLVSG